MERISIFFLSILAKSMVVYGSNSGKNGFRNAKVKSVAISCSSIGSSFGWVTRLEGVV